MQTTIQERTYSPEEIFKAFLYELSSMGIGEIKRYEQDVPFNRELHLAFLKAIRQFPETMSDFSSTVVRGNPYISTLDTAIYFLVQEGVVSTPNGSIVINQRGLPVPDENLRDISRYICEELFS